MYERILKKNKHKNITAITVIVIAVFFLALISLFVGSSNMTPEEAIETLLFRSNAADTRIIWNIRIPRIIAAILAGAGLSVSGLIMQTVLNNPMASPSTLGVSNAAVFGANLSIIAFAGGFLNVGNNIQNYSSAANPYATSLVAFVFSVVSILLILGICRIKSYQPGIVVLAGIAVGSIWTAATTILQFFATDVGISAAVIWNFGDLGRATYKTDLIMAVIVLAGLVLFTIFSWRFNALLSGDNVAKSVGINVNLLRFVSMLVASMITAVCVSFLGIIGFIGIIGPHITKKLLGQDHRVTIPVSAFMGSFILLAADTFSRTLGKGSALPVGAITSLLGAPFFLFIIFSRRRD
ncbi:MAG: iron ABC transporter permease [Lachnospiraceae bacterium]|nr:iron ABC transporter permease [Lachnospiraceae bacterium]